MATNRRGKQPNATKPKPPARRRNVPHQRRGSIETHVIVRTQQGDRIRMTRAAWEATQ